jgi:hypothetical protein
LNRAIRSEPNGATPAPREEIMIMSPTVKDTFPTRDWTSITRRGLTALSLVQTYSVELSPRLPKSLVQDLTTDVTVLESVIPGARQARNDVRSATIAERTACAQGYALVKQIRAGARKAKAPADVKAAYGVGQHDSPRVTRDVKAAIQQILERAKANPQEAADLGIVQKDIDALNLALATLTEADTQQAQLSANAPLSTKERNRTANRILTAVARIEGAGRIEFAHDEATLAAFTALGEGPKREKKANAKPKAEAKKATPEAKAEAKEPVAEPKPEVAAPQAG